MSAPTSDRVVQRDGPSGGGGGTPPKRFNVRYLIRLAVALLLVVLAWYLVPVVMSKAVSAANLRPSPGGGAHSERLLPEVEPAGTGTHVFRDLSSVGSPVAYSPCRILHVVVNLSGAPVGSLEVVERAVGQTMRASGLMIQIDGDTDEFYSKDRRPFQPDRYGDQWAPVLVSWVGSDVEPRFSDQAVATGGSYPVESGDGNQLYVTGTVTLSADHFAGAHPQSQYGTLLHEFGHLVGLGHVKDYDQIMNDKNYWGRAPELGPGDRQGLAQLGRGSCDPSI